MPAGDIRKIRQLQRWTDNYNSSRAFTGYRVMTGYFVNMNAGSFRWYHDTSVNYGFYPRRYWKSPPDRVGYLFENNLYLTGGNHMECLYSLTNNSWGTDKGSGPANAVYAPCGRHRNLTSNNMLFADGHLGNFGTTYTNFNYWPCKFK